MHESDVKVGSHGAKDVKPQWERGRNWRMGGKGDNDDRPTSYAMLPSRLSEGERGRGVRLWMVRLAANSGPVRRVMQRRLSQSSLTSDQISGFAA